MSSAASFERLDGGEVLSEVAGAQTSYIYRKWHLLPHLFLPLSSPESSSGICSVVGNQSIVAFGQDVFLDYTAMRSWLSRHCYCMRRGC